MISSALSEYKIFNSSLLDNGRVIVKNYINIGIAVDTEDGLVVPVLKSANELSFEEIGSKILDLADKARNKKLLTKDLTGATFSISSLGKIGGTGFTPIINPPEVGILSISRTKKIIELQNNEIISNNILPVALSYDHRVINGVDAGNFVSFVRKTLEKGLI